MLAVEIKGKIFKSLEELQKQFFSSRANRFWKFPAPFRPNRMVAMSSWEYTWGYMVFKGLTELEPFEGSTWSYLVAQAPEDCSIVMLPKEE